MPARIFTFKAMLEGCIRRDVESWKYFAGKYGSLAKHLLPKRFGTAAETADSMLSEFFATLSENDNAFFRSSLGSNEREFLLSFQARLFDFARGYIRSSHLARIDPAALQRTLEGFPLAHQEVAWLSLKAYPDAVIGKILRVPLSLVTAGKTEMLKSLTAWDIHRLEAGLLNDTLLLGVEKLRGANCPETTAFCRVMDGQMSWQGKWNVERHIAQCLFCLNRETGLKEAVFQLRDLPPLSADKVQSMLSSITFSRSAVASQNSIFEKVLKVFR